MQDTTAPNGDARDVRFFRALATVMAIVQVLGFVVQLAAGRSSFQAPPYVHVHALIAMGWVAIFLTQAWLVAGGARRAHRTLGVIALVWALAFVVLGFVTSIETVRAGRVPFFFQPQYLLIADPMTAVGFFAMLIGAVLLRHRPEWHARLQIGAFILIMGPSFGRLLPMPLLIPYGFQIACLTPLVFVLFGAMRDWRARGAPHIAWAWPVVTVALVLGAVQLIAYSPLGSRLYASASAGAPKALADGLAYPPPPPH